MKAWLAATIVLGGVFIVGQGMEYWSLFQSGVTVGLDLFATTFFTLTGFHGLHVCFWCARVTHRARSRVLARLQEWRSTRPGRSGLLLALR